MAGRDHKFSRQPKGSTVGGYARPRTQIGFDDEMRCAIAASAKRNDRSFAAEVRKLVAAALAQPELRRALERSVKLQSHYAQLLNGHDGGARLVFADVDAWLHRLAQLGE